MKFEKRIDIEELKTRVSYEKLYNLYITQNLKYQEILDTCKLTHCELSLLCKEYKLNKKAIFAVNISKEELYQDYIVNNMRLREVAEKYNVTEGCIRKKLNKFNIKKDREAITRNNSKFTDINPNQLRELYIDKNMAASEVGRLLGISETHIRRLLTKFNLIKTPGQFKEMQKRVSNETYAKRTEEQRLHKVEACRKIWDNMTEEQRKERLKIFSKVNSNRTPEHQAKLVASFKEYLANETEEQRIERIKNISDGTKKAMANLSEEKVSEMMVKRKKSFAERTIEQKIATLKKRRNTWINGSKEKAKQTNLERYGVEWVSQTEEFKNRAWASKKARNTTNTSKVENEIAFLLSIKYKNTLRNYKTELYPFYCDFYIPELNLYIEYQGYQGHGNEPYNPNNKCHQEIVETWQQKAKEKEINGKKSQYSHYINVWTERDPLKRETAKKNNLSWIEFFTIDEFLDWYKKQTGTLLLEYKSSIN